MQYFRPVMNEEEKRLRWPELATTAAFTLIYLLFPTINCSSDALGYAAMPEVGPHHLLYDKLSTLLHYYFTGENPVVTMQIMKILNAVLAGASLLLTGLIVNLIQPGKHNWLWLALAGAAFGFMRFATENETYILPLCFSLAGTHRLLLFEIEKNRKQLFMAFFFLGLAVLSHQMYIFWFLAACLALLLTKQIKIKQLWMPLAVGGAIGIVYYLVSLQANQSFLTFLPGDALSETVQLVPGSDNFKFTPISFIRSFIQVHGNILYLFEKYIAVKILLPIALLLLCSGAFLILRQMFYSHSKNAPHPMLYLTVIMAFILHIIFAWYAVGNAEFMVMLPVLLLIILCLKWSFSKRTLILCASGMLLWNLTSSIVPSSFIDFENTAENVKKLKQRGGYFIANNQTLMYNYFLYQTEDKYLRTAEISWLDVHLLKSPADISSWDSLEASLDQAFQNSVPVYTDCLDYPSPTSRKSIINQDKNKIFLSNYELQKTDSLSCFYGKILIYRVLPKMMVSSSDHPGSRSVPCVLLTDDK